MQLVHSRPNRTERSASTREKIIRVAVRLFAERGIEGVSLNDINKEADQRNKNATHYHFGSKEGLLQAILDKYEPAIAARRNELLDEFEATKTLTLRNTLRAVIQPMAEALDQPDGAPDYVRFSAHLVITHTMGVLQIKGPSYRISSVERVARALDAHLSHLSPTIKVQRGLLLGVFLTHALAEHSRLRDGGGNSPNARRMTEIFISNLEDCLAGMMMTPISPDTDALLQS